MIMEYRGTDAFDALNYELTTKPVKKQTKKWTKDIIHRIWVEYDRGNITEKEWCVCIKNKIIKTHLNPPKDQTPINWGKIDPSF
jgi:hypothetical protein